MRARNLKPGLFKNELLGSADPLLTILFEGLWCLADRAGRLEDRPLRICAQVFPYRRRITEKKLDTMLQWLHEYTFIARYIVGGQRYIQITEFSKHQKPHTNEVPSVIPPLSSNEEPPRSDEARPRSAVEADQGATHLALTPSSLTPSSLTADSPLTDCAGEPPAAGDATRVNGHRPSERAATKGNPGSDPEQAWRTVETCDPEAYEDWLNWRASQNDPVPAHARLYQAKFLGGKGTSAQQRSFVAELIQRQFKRLHDPGDIGGGGGLSRRPTIADYDRQSAERLAAAPGEDPGPL